jgi:NAD(P)-dependent dehydrogenase (short-subunit alcohol dehydrogenase family)
LYDRGSYKRRADGTWGLATEEVIQRFEERSKEFVPIKRLLPVEDIAGAAVYLAGDEVSTLTAYVMVVDGGYTQLWVRTVLNR